MKSTSGPLSYEEPEGDSEQLRSYTRRKLAIATQLRALLDILKTRGSQSQLCRCEELMVKLAEDRFTLAVVGQFKRGKSSLINAVIGRELLPTGVLPLTSAITVLKFGSPERVVVHREGLQFPEILPVSALPNYITERGNPGNRKKVKTAAVEVPLPFLRRGLQFVDTPGVGSAIAENSATIYRFLPECDAVIFVTSIDSPFSEAELDFLHAIRQHVRKIFFVVNKTDLLPDRCERDEVFKFIESELRAEMGTAEIKIFPVSSLLALKCSSGEGNAALSSGFQEFQDSLASFLADERATLFLSAIIDKALRLADEESHAIELHRSAREMPQARVQERLVSVESKWREVAAARQKIFERVHDALHQEAIDSTAPRLDELLRHDREGLSRHITRFVAAGRWRVGEELATRWTTFVFKQLGETTEAWTAEFASGLNLESEPVTCEAIKQLEANLREIPKLAAAVFGLRLAESEPAVPRLRAQTFGHLALAPKEPRNSLGVALRFLPVRLTARWFRAAIQELTNESVKIYRTHALALVTAGIKDAVERWTSRIDAVAYEIESRVRSAITGERAPSQTSPLANPVWGATELASICGKLEEIRGREGVDVVSGKKEFAMEMPKAPRLSAVPRPSQAIAPAPRKVDIASDLRTRGCAVCDQVVRIARDLFAEWQYAIGSEQKAQRRFAAGLGFCSLHEWQLHAMSSPLGESIGLAPLAEEISRVLRGMRPGTAATARGVRRMVHTSDSCRVCRLLKEVESDYVQRLNAFLTDESNRRIYQHSQGVCLRHLAQLIEVTSEEICQFLLAKASQHFSELAEDMQGYVIKRDAIRRNLINANEDDAYMRALIHLAGAKDYSTPWPDDCEI
jgi:GTPase Era involved in 16S rRNA processing